VVENTSAQDEGSRKERERSDSYLEGSFQKRIGKVKGGVSFRRENRKEYNEAGDP